ncbi:hypothetical protein G6F62_015647 [Rhizopus arrhizus]|nr:hypothetical protein G6F21_014156 [Rhizopus arrhizus]KAG1304997.1 hypothetical protein G6F62_015647 [Rhizopus arrhizus]
MARSGHGGQRRARSGPFGARQPRQLRPSAGLCALAPADRRVAAERRRAGASGTESIDHQRRDARPGPDRAPPGQTG